MVEENHEGRTGSRNNSTGREGAGGGAKANTAAKSGSKTKDRVTQETEHNRATARKQSQNKDIEMSDEEQDEP